MKSSLSKIFLGPVLPFIVWMTAAGPALFLHRDLQYLVLIPTLVVLCLWVGYKQGWKKRGAKELIARCEGEKLSHHELGRLAKQTNAKGEFSDYLEGFYSDDT